MPRPKEGRLSAPAGRGVTIRDFIVFQVKLAADGVRDVVAINLSIVAIVIDLLAGRGSRPRLFYGVVRLSKRFEDWLDLHRMKGMSDPDDRGNPPRLAGLEADDLIDRFEDMVHRKAVRAPKGRGEPRDPPG